MRYSPLIDRLAALPLTLLVKPSDIQHDADKTACYCPFCKGKSTTPHFIIFHNDKGGLYGTPVERWLCTETKRSGYGAVELLAAMKGLPMSGDDLRQVCLSLAKIAGMDIPELSQSDMRGKAERPQKMFTFQPAADFTPQELMSLGCTVRVDHKGIVRYGFGTFREGEWQFSPKMLNDDFRIYPLISATLPSRRIKGDDVSEVIYGTPFNPLFVCFTDKTMNCGCIFRPSKDEKPIPFSNNEDDTSSKIGRWLAGDSVFTRALELRDSTTTGVLKAIKELQPDETYKEFNTVWQGHEQVDVPVKDEDVKAKGVIFCQSPQDAVSTYYHLQSLRKSYPNGDMANIFFHVCFAFGGVDFSSVHYRKLKRFADRVYILFGNDQKSLRFSRTVCRKYRDVWRAQLPESFKNVAYQRYARLFNRPVHTVRDFFIAYHMTREESYQYDDDINKLFRTVMASALTTNPFEYKEKRDRNGNLREVYYVINPATVWEFMASEGYARDVRPDTPDKIGRFVHLDWPFVDELDKTSMVAATNASLIEYARGVARNGTDDFVLMKQAVAHSKEINEKTIVAIPAFTVDYSKGYGIDHDYFFYQNCALRITKDSITPVPYSQLDFNVDRGEVLPWRYGVPFKGDNVPFTIDENPEYVERKKEIEKHRNETDDNGRPVYTLQQIAQERSDLVTWGRSHRWKVDFNNKKIKDLWPPLRVIRGFANEHWNLEEELLRDGKSFSGEDLAELNGHFANLLFCLGRMLWRYRDSKSNCIPYLMENTVENERKAQGGSGKSSFVNVFAACAGKIFVVDCKNLEDKNNLAKSLATFRLHRERVVHWEDWTNRTDIAQLYNYATSGFRKREMFSDVQTIALNESPGMVVTSNYPPSNMDDSTMRRLCIGGFSHRFCGENSVQNKAARLITDIMPDFTNAGNVESLKIETRNQIAYIDALAVQFVMRFDEKVEAPQEDLKYRTLVRSLGDSFVRWAQQYFEQESIYCVPVDFDSAMQEYVNDFADSSEDKKSLYSRRSFRERVETYCQSIGVVMNPQHLYEKGSTSERKRYFQLSAWATERYFYGKEWEGDDTVQPKKIRVLKRCENVVFFYRLAKDKIPEDYDALKTAYREFIRKPDPAPIVDEEGNIVTLTDEEKQRWRDYKDRRQGKRLNPVAPAASAKTDDGLTDPNGEPLPF